MSELNRRRSPRLVIVTTVLGLVAMAAVAYAATLPAIQTSTPQKASR